MNVVRSFSELTRVEQPNAGGKGGTLARLYRSGYPVPDGFIILPGAFEGGELKPGVWGQVQKHLARMRSTWDGSIAFAVRSSALSEDSQHASFAGEFETILGIYEEEDIEAAIRTVRRSQLSERVQVYGRAKGMDIPHEMAVVVQGMVKAEISGVLFTADPITGSRMTMMGNFVYGLGDQLVSGDVTGESFAFEQPRGQYNGPPELKRFARRIYKLASRLEREFGCPQDIEWAIAEEKLYLLQSRPITTLVGRNPTTGEGNDSLTGDFLWSNVNFGEAVPDVMTPMTWSILKGFREEWVTIGGVPPFGNIAGRIYVNISSFASMLYAVGKNQAEIIKHLESTLHMPLPQGIRVPVVPLSRWSALVFISKMVGGQLREKKVVKTLPSFLTTNPDWCRDMRTFLKGIGNKEELQTVWENEIEPHSVRAYLGVLSSAMQFTNYTGPVSQRLTELVGPDNADALLSNLSAGDELLASLGPLVGLEKVARGEMAPDIYNDRFGHRGPHEWELSAPRSAEDSGWLDAKLEEFKQSTVDVERLLTNQAEKSERAWEQLQTSYPRKVRSIRRQVDVIASRGRLREAARSEFVRVAWVIRTWALRVGELTRLMEDIFFLEIDEVLELLSGDRKALVNIPARKATYERYKSLPPYPPIINGRFDPFQWAADPNRSNEIFDSHSPITLTSSDAIIGSAGAAGQAEGVVRVLDSLDEGNQLQPGEILVTPQTNIGWTFVFPRAAAIITDVGAPLSHAAIVARELGIPAVVGCGDATRRLKTGDRVQVDGGRGVVEVL